MRGLIYSILLFALTLVPTVAIAQAGSAGGLIGKEDKSAVGTENAPQAAPANQSPHATKRRRHRTDDGDQPSAKMETGCRKIVGTWSWFNNLDVVFSADGTGRATNGDTSNWICTGGMYQVTWHFFGNVDMLTVSSDGKSVSGTGAFGIRVTGTRK